MSHVSSVHATASTPPACHNEGDCSLSGACVASACVCDPGWTGPACEKLRLKPARLAAPFVHGSARFTWGAAPFIRRDGRFCMLFTWLTGWADGNATRPVPMSDTVSGSLGLACSKEVGGPFAIVKNVSFPFRPGKFDNSYIENPVLTRYQGGYLLAYTTSPPGVARTTLNWEGNGKGCAPSASCPDSGLQYMGLAFTTDPADDTRWQRRNSTILMPKLTGFESGIAINPAVLVKPDGKGLIVTYRGTHDDGFGNCVMADWRSECVRPKGANLFPDPRWKSTEDPFSFETARGYIMISHTFSNNGGGTKAFSRDGLRWTWAGADGGSCASDRCAYPYSMPLTNGTVLTFRRREEPKILFDRGGTTMLALINVVDDSFKYNATRVIVQEIDNTSS